MIRALSIILLSASLAIAAPKERTIIEAADAEPVIPDAEVFQ